MRQATPSTRSPTRGRRGAHETARLAHLRASTYYRTAGVVLMGVPLDPRRVETNALQTDRFRPAGALMARPPEILEIPFEDTTLPGYFLRIADDARPRATVILTGGYDGTAEELFFSNGAAALARGYNVLAFDGPGPRARHAHRPPARRTRLRARRPAGRGLRQRGQRGLRPRVGAGGFTREGVVRSLPRPNGSRVDKTLYSLLPRE